jgi:hypothetical protein
MIHGCWSAATLAVALVFVPSGPAVAQALDHQVVTGWSGQLAAAATLRSDPSPHWAAPIQRQLVPMQRSRRRKGEVLMIVGGAGILTGLLVDEEIVTIAGAGVGGFGLYLFLTSK